MARLQQFNNGKAAAAQRESQTRPRIQKSCGADRGNGTKSASSGFIIKDTPRAN